MKHKAHVHKDILKRLTGNCDQHKSFANQKPITFFKFETC